MDKRHLKVSSKALKTMKNFFPSFNKYLKASSFQTEATRDWSQLYDVQAVKQELMLHKLSSHYHMCICKVQAQPASAQDVCQRATSTFCHKLTMQWDKRNEGVGSGHRAEKEKGTPNVFICLHMGDNEFLMQTTIPQQWDGIQFSWKHQTSI